MSHNRSDNLFNLSPEANFLFQVRRDIEAKGWDQGKMVGEKRAFKGVSQISKVLDDSSGTDSDRVEKIMAIVNQRLKEHQDKGEAHYKKFREKSRGFPFYMSVMTKYTILEQTRKRQQNVPHDTSGVQEEHKEAVPPREDKTPSAPPLGLMRRDSSDDSPSVIIHAGLFQQSDPTPPPGAAPQAPPSYAESDGHKRTDRAPNQPDNPPPTYAESQVKPRGPSSGR